MNYKVIPMNAMMKTILLVEDNELNRDMLQRRLERRGYKVLCAVDGPEGIRVAASELPDLVLMDVALGEMDGWEATRILKANTRTRDIPVIALTAHALASDRQSSIAAGCCDFETKPVVLNVLIDKIEQQIANRVS